MLMEAVTQQKARQIPQSPNDNWTDLGKDGRKLSLIINQCFTRAHGKVRLKKGEVRKEIHVDLYFAYVDRMVKCMLAKERLAVTHLGVRQALQDAKR